MLENTSIILTLIIGLLAIYITYQQYRTNNDKLRLDLYEKRFSVYDGFKQAILEIEKEGNISHKGLVDFFSRINESDFLFDSDIIKYRDTFRNKLIRLQQVSTGLSDSQIPVGEKRTNLANEKEQLLNWFSSQFEEIKNCFSKYLKFKKIILF